MQLSLNFTYEEAIRSDDARRLSINNTPPAEFIPRLTATALMILQPCRDYWRKPITPTSWYRCPVLNVAIGGAQRSQHVEGEAVDFEIKGLDNLLLAKWIRDNLVFDKLILDKYARGIPSSGWIHCSYTIQRPNRNEVMTVTPGGKTLQGLGD